VKRAALLLSLVTALVVTGRAQTGLDPAKLLKPGTDSWPTYNGDYSGRRFSTLTKVNAQNIGSLSLAWVYRVNTGGTGPTTIKGTPLQINGVMYLTVPDHVWALDARTGRQIWQHSWKSTGGIHIGNRGVGVYGDWL
jgi:alcohol dehydrogenase (cytochrome c)